MFRNRDVKKSTTAGSPDPFSDVDTQLQELQRRLATLTQALSEKAEENLDLQRELAAARGGSGVGGGGVAAIGKG